jgi:type I restriction enzyme S subunit
LVCGYHLAIIRARTKVLCGDYLLRAFQSCAVNQQFQLAASGVTRYGLPKSSIGDAWVPLPSSREQQIIAAFLDRETVRIGRLVAKKRDLIERLKEKRTALISRTVTRGLPPAAARAAGLPENPPLKPSGVDWLGDIPAHWDVIPYKRVCTRVDVGIAEAATHAYCDDGIPLIRSTNVKPNRLDTSDVLRIEPWFAAKNRSKTLRAGDLVTVRTGYPGTTAPVPAEFDGAQCFTLVLSSPRRDMHGAYFSWVLNSQPGASYFEMEGWGTAQTNISVPIVQFMPVPRPPRSEQHAIAEFLSSKAAQIDALVAKVETAIERLQEYRTALITAAVTGKIDVRREVPA